MDATEADQLAKKPTDNAEAQAEYQAGRREWGKRSKRGFDNAIKHFEKAIELDPNYADPYVGLADTFGLISAYNFASANEAMPQAKSYAEKAIEINPDLAGAYTSLGWVFLNYEYDWAAADSSFRKSIQLNPNYATANHWFGLYLSNIGKHNEAIASVKKAANWIPSR